MSRESGWLAITCGPGYEPVDAVRRLTNFSTGSLGATLARRFSGAGRRVILFRAEMASAPAPEGIEVVPFGTASELLERVEAFAKQRPVAGFFHAAALSDFRVARARMESGEVEAGVGKIPSDIKRLTLELEPAPKILPLLRPIFPAAFLCGWKYEVVGGRAEALQKGIDQVRRCATDLCVVNGPAHGIGFSLVDADGEIGQAGDADGLSRALLDCVDRAGV